MATGMGSIGFFEFILMFAFGLGGGVGVPVGMPPGEIDPLATRIAPDECLFFTCWAATATPNPDSTNQVEQLLAEPEVRQFVSKLEKVAGAAITNMAVEGDRQATLFANAFGLGKILLTHSTGLFLERVDVGEQVRVNAGIIVHLDGETFTAKTALTALQKMLPKEAVTTEELGGVDVQRIDAVPGVPIRWAIRGKYLLVAAGDETMTDMTKRAASESPAWYKSVASEIQVPRPSSISYLNTGAIAKKYAPLGGNVANKALQSTGLDKLTHIATVAGLDEEMAVSKTLLAFDGALKGPLRLADAKPLDDDDLAVIPYDATVAVSLRLDLAELFELTLGTAKEFNADSADLAEKFLANIQDDLGIKLREDLFEPLGDTWCLYNSPGEGGLLLTGLTLVATVDDHAKLSATLKKFQSKLNAEFSQAAEFSRRAPRLKSLEFAGHTIHYIDVPDDDMPVMPALCLTKEHLVVALFPQNIKAMLSRDDTFRSLAERPEVHAALNAKSAPVALAYQDTAEFVKLAYPLVQIFLKVASPEIERELEMDVDLDLADLPSAAAIIKHMRPGVSTVARTREGILFTGRQTLPPANPGMSLPLVAGAGVPAVFSARESARRVQSMNNLRQIALAMLNFETVHRGFPAAYNTDKDGKPLLSWRVHVLPYLEGGRLYDQFRMDEPWDSEHNLKLVRQMPAVYRTNAQDLQEGHTVYLGVRGDGGVLAPPEGDQAGKENPTGIRMRDVRDGTFATILVLEADPSKAVPWTKPADFEYDRNNPLKGLGTLRRGGFNAVFVDGHVQFIANSINPEILLRMFDRADGESIEQHEAHGHP